MLSRRQRILACLSGIGANAQTLVGEMAAVVLKIYFIVAPGHCPGYVKSICHYKAVPLFLFWMLWEFREESWLLYFPKLKRWVFFFNTWDGYIKLSKINWKNSSFQVIACWLKNLLEDSKYKQNGMNLEKQTPTKLIDCFCKASSTILYIKHL